MDESTRSLYDVLHKEMGLVLLLFGGLRRQDYDELQELIQIAEEFDGNHIQPYLVVTATTQVMAEDSKIPILIDEGEELHHLYDATGPSVYLLRPDDYIGFRAKPVRISPIKSYLTDNLMLSLETRKQTAMNNQHQKSVKSRK